MGPGVEGAPSGGKLNIENQCTVKLDAEVAADPIPLTFPIKKNWHQMHIRKLPNHFMTVQQGEFVKAEFQSFKKNKN